MRCSKPAAGLPPFREPAATRLKRDHALALAREKGIAAPLAEWVGKTLAGDPPSMERLQHALRAAGEEDNLNPTSK